jgi:DNA mismatch repair ATPase MutS
VPFSSGLVAVTEELEAAPSSIHELSPSQNNLIACLVHESWVTPRENHSLDESTHIFYFNQFYCRDRTLAELTNYVHSKLLPQSKLLIDQDQDSQKPFGNMSFHQKKKKKKTYKEIDWFLSVVSIDPLPLSVIEDSIKQVAKRINYAPVHEDLDWLPSSLPKVNQPLPVLCLFLSWTDT